MNGRVARVSVKPKTPGEHGLPKPAVSELAVSLTGAAGDHNHYRTTQKPGDTNQALLLLTDEVLAGLRAEGWPVEPGDLGENVTLEGVPEGALKPGVRLRLGEVVAEVTLACDPCNETYVLPYVGEEKGPAFVKTLLGRRGWYARVLMEGSIRPGDPVQFVTQSAATR